MNLGIAGPELWQSQSSFSFERGILEISFMVQSLCQFIVRVTGLRVFLNGVSIFFNAVLAPAL